MALAERYLSPILSPLATFGIVFVVAVFALLQREDLRDRLIRLVGSDDLHRTTLAMDDGGRRLSKYFITQLSINTAFGVVIGIGPAAHRRAQPRAVGHPVGAAALRALCRLVHLGRAADGAGRGGGARLVDGAVDGGRSTSSWRASPGRSIEPLVYGHSTGLSPFSVVVAAIFWSWLWGPIGLILSTPLTLCLVVMGRHVKRLEFLDVMLGDRPALTPVESFYQRILAGDADEAQDHAELLLKERSLSTYYDEVALKGLQLAANDAQRGVLDHEQLDRIKATVKALVDGLADHTTSTRRRTSGRETPPDERRGAGPAAATRTRDIVRRAAAAGVARPVRGAVHRRARPAGRGRVVHAGAAARQARAGRAPGRLRRGVARRRSSTWT